MHVIGHIRSATSCLDQRTRRATSGRRGIVQRVKKSRLTMYFSHTAYEFPGVVFHRCLHFQAITSVERITAPNAPGGLVSRVIAARTVRQRQHAETGCRAPARPKETDDL
jgi:hypothetical protein